MCRRYHLSGMQALEALAGWPVGHAAAAVVVCEPDTGPPVTVAVAGQAERSGPWASVTKLCTALAVLVAVEEGTVGLDQPAGPPGSTVAHLLAHASGLGPEPGQVLARPGSRRIYSNAGFDLLGDLVAATAELPFAVYLAEAVLEPAGLHRGHAGSRGLAGLGDDRHPPRPGPAGPRAPGADRHPPNDPGPGHLGGLPGSGRGGSRVRPPGPL